MSGIDIKSIAFCEGLVEVLGPVVQLQINLLLTLMEYQLTVVNEI